MEPERFPLGYFQPLRQGWVILAAEEQRALTAPLRLQSAPAPLSSRPIHRGREHLRLWGTVALQLFLGQLWDALEGRGWLGPHHHPMTMPVGVREARRPAGTDHLGNREQALSAGVLRCRTVLRHTWNLVPRFCFYFCLVFRADFWLCILGSIPAGLRKPCGRGDRTQVSYMQRQLSSGPTVLLCL